MSIINLDAYRKLGSAAVKKPALPNTAPYYCLQCDGEDFRLYEDGAIHCVRCCCRINNLTAVRK
jgi:hypothetical protein